VEIFEQFFLSRDGNNLIAINLMCKINFSRSICNSILKGGRWTQLAIKWSERKFNFAMKTFLHCLAMIVGIFEKD
jgi:hypothetical protein